MNPFLFLRGEFRRSWGGALALALVLAFAGSLSPAVSMMERSIRSGMAQAADAFDLLVGAKGSAVDLVLGAVYLRPEPLPLLPLGTLEAVKAHGGVRWAAPLAFGDRWRDYPLAGTSSELVTLGGKRPLASGRMFLTGDEAVVGAGVPLKEGDVFSPSHGSVAEAALDEGGRSAHDHSFRVVGRMPATGTPWDRAVVVPIEALWNMHDAGTGSGRCSVVVVKPVTVADAYRLRGALNGPESQSVFTGEVLTRLFGTMEQMHDVMMLLASGAQAAALAAALVSGFFAVAMRVRALALLRALGASHGFLAVSVWLMVSGVLLAGSALGLGLGCLMASAASSWIQAETGVALTVTLTAGDALAALAAAGCGCLAAFLPAWFACRRTAGELLRSA
ncbi:ABC transporter permease [uncultured Mailhella sp.]|uniref:ABC transporter permease n=1 Tax=uncultured Mailhella sp. TaxID=1981031 RepID=UPI0032097644